MDELGINGRQVFVFNGTVWERVRTPIIFKPFTDLANNDVIWHPAVGKRIRLMGLVISCGIDADVIGVAGDLGTLTFSIPVNKNLPLNFPSFGINGILFAVDENLTANTTLVVSGLAFGTEE